MKNKEKFMDVLMRLACDKYDSFSVNKDTGRIGDCNSIECNGCKFSHEHRHCRACRLEWLEQEYVELPVISKNDRRFLDGIGNTYKYIVRDRDGKLFVCKKVYAVNDEWFSKGCVVGSDYTYISGFDVVFPMVEVISSTVWSIKDLKKLEVVEEY